MINRTPVTIALHVIIALALAVLGIYTFVSGEIFLGGSRTTGEFYALSYLGSVLTALSLLSFSAFLILLLLEGSRVKKISELVVTIGVVMFFVGVFI